MPNPAEDDFGPWSKSTPADGRIVFSQLVAEDDYEITITHPDYDTHTAQLYLDSSGRQPIYRIEESTATEYRLTLQVSDPSGVAISGVDVTADALTKTTGSNGEVWFDLSPATYSVTFSHPDYLDASQSITLGEADQTEPVTLESASGTSSGPAGDVLCRTDATIAAGESITLSVYEDIDNTGSIDNTTTVSVPDGVSEQSLSGFSGTGGNRYTVQADFSADTDEGTPQLHSVEVESQAAEPVAMMYGQAGGTALEIPLYNPSDVADARMQANPPGIADIAAFALVDSAESPLQCRTPDGEIHGVLTNTADSSTETLEAQMEQHIHQETNDHRTSQGLATINFRDDVADVARNHSQDMVERDFFDHTNPDGEDAGARLSAAGISNTGWAENIAWEGHSGVDESNATTIAQSIFDGWLNSTGHRENIERSVDAEGVGIYISADRVYATTKFISN